MQIPLSSTTTSTLPAGLPVELDSSIASVASTFGGGVTPTVDLLRIWFLF